MSTRSYLVTLSGHEHHRGGWKTYEEVLGSVQVDVENCGGNQMEAVG